MIKNMLLGSMLFDLSPIVTIITLIVIAGIALMVAGYLKAPPDTAYVISGLGKKRILIGKAGCGWLFGKETVYVSV